MKRVRAGQRYNFQNALGGGVSDHVLTLEEVVGLID